MTDPFILVVGIAILFLGRALFWLFVGLAAFVAGLMLTSDLMSELSDWMIFLISVLSGLIGMAAVVFLQKLTVALVGLFAGGFLAIPIAGNLDLSIVDGQWMEEFAIVPFAIGAILGLILSLLLFDWALTILSVLVGSTLIIQAIQLNDSVELLVFGILVVVGFAVQVVLRPTRPPESEES